LEKRRRMKRGCKRRKIVILKIWRRGNKSRDLEIKYLKQ
jgi:hypothetical protein